MVNEMGDIGEKRRVEIPAEVPAVRPQTTEPVPQEPEKVPA